MSIGLHCRLARPGRVHGLAEFLDFARSYGRRDVWFCTREQIADFWYENHFPFGASQTLDNGPQQSEDTIDEELDEQNEAKVETKDDSPAEEEGDFI